jgi:hypothetical protein
MEQCEQRLRVRERVGLGRIGIGREAASLEQPDDPSRHLTCRAADRRGAKLARVSRRRA